jgi:hypothetical protein
MGTAASRCFRVGLPTVDQRARPPESVTAGPAPTELPANVYRSTAHKEGSKPAASSHGGARRDGGGRAGARPERHAEALTVIWQPRSALDLLPQK